MGTFINILTGHCFNKHLFRLGVVASPICRFCLEEDETVSHIVCECPALIHERLSTFGSEHIEHSVMFNTGVKVLFHFVKKFLRPEADT